MRSCKSPIILANDSRVTTPYPDFHGFFEVLLPLNIFFHLLKFIQLWPLNIKAQSLLLKSCRVGRKLTSNDSDDNHDVLDPSAVLRERICELDSLASALACEFDQARCIANRQDAEAFAGRNMWDIGCTMTRT